MLLVVAANGHIGSAIVNALAGTPHQVRALVRRPDHFRPAASNIEVVAGELAETDSVERALEGIDTAFLASSLDASLPELQIRFIEAAKAAGVRRIVQLSGIGADTSSCCVRAFSWYGQVEQALLASGLQHIRLRPAFVLQSLLRATSQLVHQGVIFGPYRNAPWVWVDARDIGEVAATVMTTEAHNGQVYTVTGAEALPFPELADRVSRVLNVPVRYLDVTSNEMRGRLQAMGTHAIVAAAIIEMCDAYVSGYQRIEPTSVVQELTGHPPRTIEQFLTDYRDRFLQPA